MAAVMEQQRMNEREPRRCGRVCLVSGQALPSESAVPDLARYKGRAQRAGGFALFFFRLDRSSGSRRQTQLHERKKMNVFGLKHFHHGDALGLGKPRQAFLEERRIKGLGRRKRLGGRGLLDDWLRWLLDLGLQELIGGGHDADEMRIVLGAFRCVVMLEDIDKRGHEIPTDSHPAAGLAVIHTEIVALDGNVVYPVVRRQRALLGRFFHDENPKGELADIVEQADEIGLLFFKVIDLASNAFAKQRGKEAMLPKGRELPWRHAFAGKLHDRTSEHHGAQTLGAKKDGGLFDADDATAQAKKSRVAQTKDLSTKTGIGANDFANFFEIDRRAVEQSIQIQDVLRQSGQPLAEYGHEPLLTAFLTLHGEGRIRRFEWICSAYRRSHRGVAASETPSFRLSAEVGIALAAAGGAGVRWLVSGKMRKSRSRTESLRWKRTQMKSAARTALTAVARTSTE